jgi:hypothetical protein
LTHNVCDFLAQKLRKSRRIVRQILLARGHDLANGRGPYEAAYMTNKDTIRAAFHAPSPPFVHSDLVNSSPSDQFLTVASSELNLGPGTAGRRPL